MAQGLFRENALMQHRLHGEVMVLPQLNHSIVALALLAWTGALIYWLCNSNYARQETVQGWLQPTEGVVRLFADNNNDKIKRVLVQEGQKVLSGQALIEIKADRTLTNGNNLETELLEQFQLQATMLDQQLAHNQHINQSRLADLALQQQASQKHISSIRRQLTTLDIRQAMLAKRLATYARMLQQQHISQLDHDRVKEQKLALISEIQKRQNDLQQQQNQLQQLDNEQQQLPQQFAKQRAQLISQRSQLDQQMTRLKGQQSYMIRASRDGIVTNLQAVEGQQVNTSQPLMTLLPQQSELQMRLLVPVRAAGFVEPGQALQIRYDAFPYQKFGLYEGEIVSISDSVLLPNEINALPLAINEPVYMITAALQQTRIHAFGLSLDLKSGMTLSADVQLGERSLLDWLLEPILSLRGRL